MEHCEQTKTTNDVGGFILHFFT